MKTKEELNALKEEVETLNKKLAELTEEELSLVTGGDGFPVFGGAVIEVGKWYKRMNENPAIYAPTLQQSSNHYYCAEKAGDNKFRFEIYLCETTSQGNKVSFVKESIESGFGFEDYSAPFPLPDGFDISGRK